MFAYTVAAVYNKYTLLVVFMVRIAVLLRPISALIGSTYSTDIVTDIWHDPRKHARTHARTHSRRHTARQAQPACNRHKCAFNCKTGLGLSGLSVTHTPCQWPSRLQYMCPYPHWRAPFIYSVRQLLSPAGCTLHTSLHIPLLITTIW